MPCCLLQAFIPPPRVLFGAFAGAWFGRNGLKLSSFNVAGGMKSTNNLPIWRDNAHGLGRALAAC